METKTIFDLNANVREYYNPHRDIFERFERGLHNPSYVKFVSGDCRSGVGIWMREAGYTLYHAPKWFKECIYRQLECQIKEENVKHTLERILIREFHTELNIE